MQLQPGQHLNEGGCHKRNHHIFAHQFCKIPPSHWCMPSAIARCNMLLQYPGMQDLTITASNTKTSNTQIRVFQKAWLVIIITENDGRKGLLFGAFCFCYTNFWSFLLEKQEEIWGERLRGRSLKRNIYILVDISFWNLEKSPRDLEIYYHNTISETKWTEPFREY